MSAYRAILPACFTCLTIIAHALGAIPAPISVADNGGPPRPWEAGIQATPFALVSMRQANVTSTIELAS